MISENEKGNRGSKLVIKNLKKNITIKEQRVNGNYCKKKFKKK